MDDNVNDQQPQVEQQVQQQQAPAQQEQEQGTTVSELETLLAGIKDHTGRQKYSDPVTALSALDHSQSYIQTLEAEKQALQEQLEKLQEDLNTRMSVEDALSNFNTQNQQSAEPAAVTPDPASIQQLVAEYLQQHQQQQSAEANRSAFASKLKAAFGEDYNAKVEAKAAELGVPVNVVVSTAEASPAAALAMLGVGSNPTPQQPPVVQSQVNTAADPNSLNTPPSKPTGSGVLGFGATTASTMKAMRDIRAEIEQQYNQ